MGLAGFGAVLGVIGLVLFIPAVRVRVNDIFWFAAKVAGFMYLYIWYRGTFPRYRFDQLMKVGWKILLPTGLGAPDPHGRRRHARRIVGTAARSGTSMNPPVATPFFFYLLAATMIIGGILVITRKNAIHSAMALITTLLAQAALYLMLYAPFVAGVQIILYAGGIMVLFLFVIMLITIERNMKERQFNKQWLVGIAAAAALGGLFIAVYTTTTKGQSALPRRPNDLRRNAEHPGDRGTALRPQRGTVHVRLRNRLAAAAGGDYRGGGDGEEKDLAASFEPGAASNPARPAHSS